FGAGSGHAITQPLVIVRVVDLLREPAAHLHASIRGHQRLDTELGIDLVPQLLAAAEVNPRAQLVGGHAVRPRGEEIQPLRLAAEVTFVALIDICDAGRNSIESLQSSHKTARRINSDL